MAARRLVHPEAGLGKEIFKDLADAFWNNQMTLSAVSVPANATSKSQVVRTQEARVDVHKTSQDGRYQAIIQLNSEARSAVAQKLLAGSYGGYSGIHQRFGKFYFRTGAQFNALGVYQAIKDCWYEDEVPPAASAATLVSQGSTRAFKLTWNATKNKYEFLATDGSGATTPYLPRHPTPNNTAVYGLDPATNAYFKYDYVAGIFNIQWYGKGTV